MLDNDNNKLFLSCGYLPHGRLLIVAILAYKRGWLGGGSVILHDITPSENSAECALVSLWSAAIVL